MATRENGALTAHTLWVCTDCHLAHAGYDAHELGLSDARWAEIWSRESGDISHGLLPAEHSTDCPNLATDAAGELRWLGLVDCECEHRDFSRSDCDGCGDHHAGDRYGYTQWVPTPGHPAYL